MKETFENEYMVFNVAEGPKVMIEALNSRGQQGWRLSDIINIGTDRLCALLVKRTVIDDPNPKKSAQKKIDDLWSGDDSE